jgi:hypothetical protein
MHGPPVRFPGCSLTLRRLSILIRPTNDNLRVARDPPGIGIRQPLFAFPRKSLTNVR